jgi:hypothetical protein
MKFILFLQFLVFGVTFGHAQDSILITNHYAVVEEIQCCRHVTNQLECIDSLIELSRETKRSNKDYESQFFKQQKALVIYNINAGGINKLRGNHLEAKSRFRIAKKYADSLKRWTSHYQDVERIFATLSEKEREWCFRMYRMDTVAFYACDCAKFFPELNDSAEVINEASTVVPPTTVTAIPKLFGTFYLNDSLRFDPRFISDKTSTAYFKKNQSQILSNLSKQAFSEIMREMSTTGDKNGNQLDSLIIKVDLSNKENQLIKKCSVVYTNSERFISEYYLHLFMNMDFPVTRETVSFYIPIVIKRVESDVYYNLDRTILENDHYLIEYEKLRRISLH